MPEQTADFLRAQSRRCRALAATTLDKRVAKTLSRMAEEYDAKAVELEQKPEQPNPQP